MRLTGPRREQRRDVAGLQFGQCTEVDDFVERVERSLLIEPAPALFRVRRRSDGSGRKFDYGNKNDAGLDHPYESHKWAAGGIAGFLDAPGSLVVEFRKHSPELRRRHQQRSLRD